MQQLASPGNKLGRYSSTNPPWCGARISVKECIARKRLIHEALSLCQLGSEDRDIFNTLFPDGIPIHSKDVRDFGMFIRFPDGVESPSVIIVWLHAIERLQKALAQTLDALGNASSIKIARPCDTPLLA